MPATDRSLADAIQLAASAHGAQRDKAGMPYFGHLRRVAERVSLLAHDGDGFAKHGDCKVQRPTATGHNVVPSSSARLGGEISRLVDVARAEKAILRELQRRGAYAASKAALGSLVRTMAVECLPLGVHVNAISPVATETPMSEPLFRGEPGLRERMAQGIPAARLGLPSDYVGAVRFLLSQDSDFLVGQTLYLDGGASIGHPLLGSR